MSSVSLTQLTQAVAGTLGVAPSLAVTHTPDHFKEGITDVPLMEVYPEKGTPSSRTGTERQTMGGGVREHEITFFADIYVAQRGNYADYMVKYMRVADELITLLEAQRSVSFGLTSIKAMRWDWERADIIRNEIHYPGVRFSIVLYVF